MCKNFPYFCLIFNNNLRDSPLRGHLSRMRDDCVRGRRQSRSFYHFLLKKRKAEVFDNLLARRRAQMPLLDPKVKS